MSPLCYLPDCWSQALAIYASPVLLASPRLWPTPHSPANGMAHSPILTPDALNTAPRVVWIGMSCRRRRRPVLASAADPPRIVRSRTPVPARPLQHGASDYRIAKLLLIESQANLPASGGSAACPSPRVPTRSTRLQLISFLELEATPSIFHIRSAGVCSFGGQARSRGAREPEKSDGRHCLFLVSETLTAPLALNEVSGRSATGKQNTGLWCADA